MFERRRARERDAEFLSELRWQWRSGCSATLLSQLVYTPSGAARSVPLIGQIDLGPPVTFTVRMRAGQTLDDYTAAAPVIASAMDVAALRIVPLAPHWIRVVLVPASGAERHDPSAA